MGIEAFLQTLNARLGQVRRETLNERSYLVAPFTSVLALLLTLLSGGSSTAGLGSLPNTGSLTGRPVVLPQGSLQGETNVQKTEIGVYCWLNKLTGKRYVGSASSVRSGGLIGREDTHVRALNGRRHKNIYFQRAWNKYGQEAFEFTVLEVCLSPEDCIPREQFWMDHYQSYKKRHGYNIAPTAGSNLGMKASARTVAKMRDAHLGKMPSAKNLAALREAASRPKGPMSEAHKAKISAAVRKAFAENPDIVARGAAKRRGRVPTEAHRKAVSAGLMGHPVSEETREKLRRANLGKSLSEETKQKLRVSSSKLRHTEESKAKISAANKGQRLTPAQTRRMILGNAARRGRSLSEEHRKKISEGLRGQVRGPYRKRNTVSC